MNVKRHCFTLLELMIVLTIISFGVMLTGVKLKQLYHEQRLLSEAQQVLSHLAMAQDLMLIMDTDVQVKIAPDPESEMLQIWLEVEKPFKETWAHFVERKVTLKAIRSLQFENSRGKEIDLRFSFGRMSKGVLMIDEGEKHESRIELAGFPRPLKITTIEEKEPSFITRRQTEASKALYPAEVYEKLYEDPNQEDEEETT